QNLGSPSSSYPLSLDLGGQRPFVVRQSYSTFRTSGAEPTIEFPENGAINVAPWDNHFSWNAVQNASTYEGMLTKTMDFSDTWDCDYDSLGCVSKPLHTLTTYGWRVRARGPIDPRTSKARIGDWAGSFQSPGIWLHLVDQGIWAPNELLT